MMVDFQFSRIGELAMRGQERGVSAKVGRREIRKRSSRHADAVARNWKHALRGRETCGEVISRRERSVVTSDLSVSAWLVKKVEVALRMKLRPPEPNQTLQPTRMLVTIRADARLAPSIRVADL